MTGLEWVFTFTFAFLYVFLVFTVAVVTFQKGHTVLGVLGIFLPFLWLIGVMLPPTASSTYAQA